MDLSEFWGKAQAHDGRGPSCMASAYRRLFDDDAAPSLALAQGRADPGPRLDPADETAESHCAAWLAGDRRRALLAEVGVGTIDQALLAILHVRKDRPGLSVARAIGPLTPDKPETAILKPLRFRRLLEAGEPDERLIAFR